MNGTNVEVSVHRQIMTVATRVAKIGINGVIFLAEKARWLRGFQKRAVEDREWRRELESYGGDKILEPFNKRYEKDFEPISFTQLKTFSYFLKLLDRKCMKESSCWLGDFFYKVR